APGRHQLAEVGVLLRELGELGALGDDVGLAEERRELLVAGLDRGHAATEMRIVEHGSGRRETGASGELLGGAGARTVLLVEPLDPAGGVEQLLLAGEER